MAEENKRFFMHFLKHILGPALPFQQGTRNISLHSILNCLCQTRINPGQVSPNTGPFNKPPFL